MTTTIPQPDRSTPPPVKSFGNIELPLAHSEKLANGVSLTTVNSDDMEMCRLCLMWEGGTADAPLQEVALITAETLTEGADGITGAEMADALDFNSARIGVKASEHYTGIDAVFLASRLEDVLPLLDKAITSPTFPEQAVSHSARKFSMAKSMALQRVANVASTALQQMMYGPEHLMARDASPEEIANIGRQEIEKFYKNIACTSGLHAFFAGNDKSACKVHKFLSELPSITRESILCNVPAAPVPPETVEIEMPDSLQTAIAMGIPAISRHDPDYIPLRFAIRALGGYFGSRLMSNIREEKGLTYGIGAYLLGTADCSYVNIATQCRQGAQDEVMREVISEIESLWKNPVEGEELLRLRRNIWGELAGIVETPFTVLNYYIMQLQNGVPENYFAEQLHYTKTITGSLLSEIAHRHLSPSTLRTVIVK